MKPCTLCDDEKWVCEDHPDLPWDSWHQANCGAGQACICNPCHSNHWSDDDKKRLEEFERRQDMFNGKKAKS